MNVKAHIYADHAATAPLLAEALEAMLLWLRDGFGNPSSLHSFGRKAGKAVEAARAEIAECIGASPEEIFFTSGGTEADNWVVKSLGRNGAVISAFEHHAVLNAFKSLGSRRQTCFLRPNRSGVVSTDDLHELLDRFGLVDRPPCLVSVMLANNEVGTIQPIRELAAIAHERGHLFHTDAVQAVGRIPVDVRDLGVDYLSASAHKFGGPKGVGFLYAKDGKAPSPLLDGGAQERGRRAGTENVAAVIGMASALRVSCERMAETTGRLNALTTTLRDGIRRVCPDAVFHCAESPQLPGFTSVAFPGHPAEGMLHILDIKGIAVSAGAACNSRETEISHVLRAIGIPDDLARATLRLTLGMENMAEDAATIIAVLDRIGVA